MADDERAFRDWYRRMAERYGLGSDPDDPQQFYDYRAAFKAGAKPDASGHWPSQFKREGHPNMVVGGFNVKTGERVPGTKRASESELVNLGWDAATAKRLAAMPEQDTDPLVALLDKSGLSVAQKRGLWDLYTAAKDTGDLQKRLDSLKLPDAVKHDLWNLKATEVETPDEVAEPVVQPTEPSEGYWEDRGIAGKVWHPASGVKEGNRVDNSILGVPPELAALGAGAVGRAVVQPGLNAAGRVLAGATSAVGQAAPIVGYEAAHYGLKAVGVPEPFATIGAGVVGARMFGRKGAPAAAEAEAAPVVPNVGIPKTAESPLELTRRLRAEWRAANPLPPKVDPEVVKQEFKTFFNPPKAAIEAAKNVPKLKVQETALAMKLLKSGLKSDEVLETILELRKMPVSWRSLPTDAEVASIISARNAARAAQP